MAYYDNIIIIAITSSCKYNYEFEYTQKTLLVFRNKRKNQACFSFLT